MTTLIIVWSVATTLGSIPPGLWALAGTVVGGVGLKLLEQHLARTQGVREDRRDFRSEISELVTRVDQLEHEVETWRTRYFEQQENVAILRRAIIDLGGTPPPVAIHGEPDVVIRPAE